MNAPNALLLAELKQTSQDFEWYPTTTEIIRSFYNHVNQFEISSLLDVGAGNGKVLLQFEAFKKAENEEILKEKPYHRGYSTNLFAVEKARPLLDQLPIDISIMGTDFDETIFLDKKVDCIFSNPPYKDFIHWSTKLIREANAKFIYLVLPQRWKLNQEIAYAIKSRNANYNIVGEFDFINAEDRQARAKVDLICIELVRVNHDYNSDRYSRLTSEEPIVDAFELWVKTNFGLEDKPKDTTSEYDNNRKEKEARGAKLETALVQGSGIIEILHNLYQADLAKLLHNYRNVCELDADLFKELDISVKSVIANIKSRIKGLKDAYWYELFENYEVLTSRLTEKSRTNFIRTIRANTNIDFTPANAYAITAWAIKHANQYFDIQMINVFDEMVSLANVECYKSNQRVFKENTYRYSRFEETHIKLDFRIVLQCSGGLSTSTWRSENMNGLEIRAANFLNDLLVIAANLGFQRNDSVNNHYFKRSEKHTFTCKSRKDDKSIELYTVRAYKNGNMHISLNKEFALALNVEVGRLKGWIHNAQHAAEELNEDLTEVNKFFKRTFTLLPGAMDQLLLGA